MKKIILSCLVGLCLVLSIGCKEKSFSIDVSGKDIVSIGIGNNNKVWYVYKVAENKDAKFFCVFTDSKGETKEFGPYNFFIDETLFGSIVYENNFYKNTWSIISDGQEYTSILDNGLPDIKNNNYETAYIIKVSPIEYYILFNGKNIGPYEDIRSLKISPDGNHIAYVAKTDGKYRIGYDDELWMMYEASDVYLYADDGFSLLQFSHDGKKLAYSVKKDDKNFLFVGGRFIPIKTGAYNLVFSPDDKNIAFTTDIDKKSVLFISSLSTDKTKRINEAEFIFGVKFSHDGKDLTYTNKENGRYHILTEKNKFGSYDKAYRSFFLSDNTSLAYIAKINNQVYVFNGNQKIGPYKDVADLVFSKYTKSIAYSYTNGSGVYLVYDNKEFGPYNNVLDMKFSPDGNVLAYKILKENSLISCIVINGMSYIGGIYNNKVVYLKDDKIIIKPKQSLF
ncbi:TolB family protein [Treponema denticola]|uniref:TolB family protein n=1 Tax=Treponema denticola TaxID=158 RepID=UPI0020A24C07|nr:hypothetical protein [Treponema denticola]UTC92612.1 hypothetical protein E4N84_05725 [Treponema denticola]